MDDISKVKEVLAHLDQKFTSGNDVPVQRSTITREEYEVIAQALRDLIELVDQFSDKDVGLLEMYQVEPHPHYDCPKCKDTGWIGETVECECAWEKAINANK